MCRLAETFRFAENVRRAETFRLAKTFRRAETFRPAQMCTLAQMCMLAEARRLAQTRTECVSVTDRPMRVDLSDDASKLVESLMEEAALEPRSGARVRGTSTVGT